MNCIRCNAENKVAKKAYHLDFRCSCNDQGVQCEEIPFFVVVFSEDFEKQNISYMCKKHYYLLGQTYINPETKLHAITCPHNDSIKQI